MVTAKKIIKKKRVLLKKRRISGSAKGGAFERLMAKRLSLWISDGSSADLLWRSAGSGGRSTMRRKQTGRGIEYHASDLAPLHPDAAPFVDTFTVECKSYAKIELRQVVYNWESSLIAKWWAQASRDAASVSRIPLLIIKENQQRSLIVVPDPPHEYFQSIASLMPSVHLLVPSLCIVDLEAMLTCISFETFKELYASTLPSRDDLRPSSDRPRKRRVPLVGI